MSNSFGKQSLCIQNSTQTLLNSISQNKKEWDNLLEFWNCIDDWKQKREQIIQTKN